MVINRLYRQTMTQLNAINTVVDYVRSIWPHGVNESDQRIPRALKVLEARAEILRARANRNRAARSKNNRRRRRKETLTALAKSITVEDGGCIHEFA